MVSKVKRMRDCDAITIHLLNKVLHDSGKPYPKMNQVRRNLFGFSKLNKESQLLDKRITDMAQKSSEEWNFDFLNEIPQTGRYVWQRVHCYDVPMWYATTNLTAFNDDCCSQSNEGDAPDSTSHSSEECFHLEKENKKSNKKPRLVQTSMKDFARVQKRRSSRRLRLKQLKKKRLQKLITSTALEVS